MKNKLEEQFDGICNKAMPLILFSYSRFKEPLIEKIRILFEAFVSNDSMSFDENYKQIITLIDEREIFDSNRERLIKVFSSRNKSYNDKFEELFMEIDRIKKLIRKKKFHSEKKSIDNDSSQHIKTDENKTCPLCHHNWLYKGKGQFTQRKGFRSIHCPKCKKYFHEKVIE